jgi:pyridoxal phosphate enzyme (YggS family)
MSVLDNYSVIEKSIKKINSKAQCIVVSKNFEINLIIPLIDLGHAHFGENRVQEAKAKWSSVLINNNKINLHMLGKLQSNKVDDCVKLFSYVHSLDSKKLADYLSSSEVKNNKKLKYFVQVNIGNEKQKSGILPSEANNFIDYCKNVKKLHVIGLMCIPPIGLDVGPFFLKLRDLALKNNLHELSMGMSDDYIQALKLGSTFVRIGTGIFGRRN